MSHRYLVLILSIFLLDFTKLASATEISSKRPLVTFFIAADPGFPFWDSQIDFAQAVARALDVELDVIHTPREFRNRFDVVQFAERQLDAKKIQPDLVITSFWLGSEKAMLDMLSQRDVSIFTINSNISDEQFTLLGKPREKYPNWLAHLSPDDTLAGKLLTEGILNHPKVSERCKSHESCDTDIFAITGLNYSAVSLQRIQGLQTVINTQQNANLINVVYGNWKRETVASMIPTIARRHPELDAIWVASDIMAYGIEDALKSNKVSLPQHTVIGSMDWSPETVQKIKNNQIDLSLGGHFLEAGWALLMYFDFIHDVDFKPLLGTVIHSEMSILDGQNIEQLGEFLANPQWSESVIKRYSKYLTPSQSDYQYLPNSFIWQNIEVRKSNSG